MLASGPENGNGFPQLIVPNVVTAATVVTHLSPALQYLETFPQFIVYFLTPAQSARETNKIPVHPASNPVRVDNPMLTG